MDFSVPSMVSCYNCDYFWIVLLFFRESFCLFLHNMSALQPFPSELSPSKLHFNAKYIHFVVRQSTLTLYNI